MRIRVTDKIAEQRQRTEVKSAETEKSAAIWKAEKERAVSLINLHKLEERKQSQIEIARLESQ